MPKNCVAQGISSTIKVIQTHSDHDKIVASKCIWSYLSQFLTVFDEPRNGIDGNKHENTGV